MKEVNNVKANQVKGKYMLANVSNIKTNEENRKKKTITRCRAHLTTKNNE